jgi:hypothetical protein
MPDPEIPTIMKLLFYSLIMSLISVSLSAQTCHKEWVFNLTDKENYSVSCGEQAEDGWLVARNSCNFYTPLTAVETSGKGRWIRFQGEFESADQMEERDFVWIFYFVDGKTAFTRTLNGVPGTTSYSIADSFFVDAGSNFRLRIALVCDEPDEFWKIPSAKLKICQQRLPDDDQMLQPPQIGKITAIKERGVVRLSWVAPPAEGGNYFMIERSKNNSIYEFAGYVRESRKLGESINTYSFIDAGATAPIMFYRLTKVDITGQSSPFGDVVSLRLP